MKRLTTSLVLFILAELAFVFVSFHAEAGLVRTRGGVRGTDSFLYAVNKFDQAAQSDFYEDAVWMDTPASWGEFPTETLASFGYNSYYEYVYANPAQDCHHDVNFDFETGEDHHTECNWSFNEGETIQVEGFIETWLDVADFDLIWTIESDNKSWQWAYSDHNGSVSFSDVVSLDYYGVEDLNTTDKRVYLDVPMPADMFADVYEITLEFVQTVPADQIFFEWGFSGVIGDVYDVEAPEMDANGEFCDEVDDPDCNLVTYSFQTGNVLEAGETLAHSGRALFTVVSEPSTLAILVPALLLLVRRRSS